MIKTKTWIIIISILLTVCLAAALWLYLTPASGNVAKIYQDGVCIRSVYLSADREREVFTVSSYYGENVIEISGEGIRIISADCPDKVCIDAGYLTSAAPIVCLPHRLVIRLESGDGDVDTVVR